MQNLELSQVHVLGAADIKYLCISRFLRMNKE